MTPDYHELDQLSSQELHDRAMARAKKHFDVGFLWEVVKTVPVAEAAKGDTPEAEQDIAHPLSQITDAVARDAGLVDALRPVYLEYLSTHDDA